MAPTRDLMKTLLVTAFFVMLPVLAFGQGPEPPSTPAQPGVEEVYLAKDNAGRPGDEAAKEFSPNDIPIYCVVVLDSTAITTVKMNFVAVSVAGVKPDTKVVTASYTTKEGQNRVNFTGRPYDRWTPGTYRVDLFVNGKPSKTVEFTIKGSAVVAPTPASKFNQTTAKPKPKTKRPVNNLTATKKPGT